MLGAGEAPAFLAPKPVSFIFGVGKVSAARLAARRLSPHRRSAARQRSRADAPLRRGRPPPRAARPRHRRSARSAPIAKPKAFPRRRRSTAISPTSARSSGFSGSQTEEVSARLKAKALGRRDRDAETQNRRLQDSHPRAFARFADPACRQDFCRRARPPRARNRRHEIPPARRRRQRPHHGGCRPIRRISSTAGRPRPNMRSTGCAPASAMTPWSEGSPSSGRRNADGLAAKPKHLRACLSGHGFASLISSEVSLPVTTKSL